MKKEMDAVYFYLQEKVFYKLFCMSCAIVRSNLSEKNIWEI